MPLAAMMPWFILFVSLVEPSLKMFQNITFIAHSLLWIELVLSRTKMLVKLFPLFGFSFSRAM